MSGGNPSQVLQCLADASAPGCQVRNGPPEGGREAAGPAIPPQRAGRRLPRTGGTLPGGGRRAAPLKVSLASGGRAVGHSAAKRARKRTVSQTVAVTVHGSEA